MSTREPSAGHGGESRGGAAAPRVRLVDVAREAGLSKTTVSAALNGTGRLSPAVREKAVETARRMGYRPNATARQLRAGRARLIGYVVGEFAGEPWTYLDSPYFARLTGATASAALRHGYALVMLPAGTLQREWADLPLEAVIVADPVADDPLVADLLAARIPVFSDASVAGRPGAHWVDLDTDAAVRECLEHLRAGGARRTALVLPDSSTRFHRQVLAAYRAWCAEHGAEERLTLVPEPGNGPVVRAVERALGRQPRPDGLFVVAEASPPLVMDAARRLGLTVPGDVRVVCVSEDESAAHADPPVTTLSLCPEELAEQGMALLVAALEGGVAPPRGRDGEGRAPEGPDGSGRGAEGPAPGGRGAGDTDGSGRGAEGRAPGGRGAGDTGGGGRGAEGGSSTPPGVLLTARLRVRASS
ncbi:LacI family DNA-binding transcriptional regulator [Streptomyces sp. NPDC004787]|uniref:LacI family DNA-binding transcriptional regulator n=1 Tax=Streptomyces sp. NPDC004787 TaxID=3154291 RepID=UPI0033B21442